MERKFDVIILGAGCAGLSAAERLVRFGIKNFVVLEARDRTGGRVHVREHNGDKIHMGAQWIHQFCPENTLVQLAKKYKLVNDSTPITGGDMNPDEYFDSEHVYTSTGRHIPEALVKKASKIYKLICDLVSGDADSDLVDMDDPTKTLEDVFEKIAQSELTKLSSELSDDDFEMVAAALYGYKNGLAHFVCGDLNDCSLEVYTSSNILPGDDVDLPFDLIDSIAADLPTDSIKLSHVVKTVDWTNEDSIRVTCAVEGSILDRVYVGRHVICTLPIGVLQARHAEMFQPPLPARKVKAMFSISAGTTAKYFVSWDQPWRIPNDSPIMLAWTRKELNSLRLPEEWYKGIMEFSAEDCSKGSLMTAWIGGKAAEVADTLPDEQIIQDIGNVIRKFTGNPDVPDPDHLVRECWTKDEFTLGAYSYPKLGACCKVFKQMGEPLPTKNDPRLLFAGEATTQNLWSYLHGARLTGIVEADRVIKILKK